jgi:ubiquinone/menaquinone biosynthesis C-methylase UbiE
MSDFKDLFSVQASDYAKFRPTYPPELFEYLNTTVKDRNCAWDAGTGNGQAALELANFFRKVIATDPSEKQIAEAPHRANILYLNEKAESPSFTEKVNLITVAQAFHWFDHSAFARACEKVAAPGCLLAVWSYAMTSVTPEVEAAVLPFYNGLLGPYWEKERKDVENGYRNISMPFEELKVPEIKMTVTWTFDRFAGYLKTWSALQKFVKANPQEDLRPHFERIEKAWGNVKERPLSWPLHLRVWKV